MRCLDRAKMALSHVFPCIGIWFDPWDSFQVGFLPWDQTSNMAPFDHHYSRGEKSATPFPVVRHRFRKVFWHRMGPLKENPTGYDEFYALWAFLSHSTALQGVWNLVLQEANKDSNSNLPKLRPLRWSASESVRNAKTNSMKSLYSSHTTAQSNAKH